MRIGIITHNYPLTSEERKDAGIFIYDFAQELSKSAEVFVLCPNFPGKKEDYRKVPVTWFEWNGGEEKFGDWKLFSPLSFLKFCNLLFRGKKATEDFVKDNKIDFLLGAWGLPAGILSYLGTKRTKTPYAIWSLGSDINKYFKFPILNLLMKLSYKNAKVIFANSFSLLHEIKKLTGRAAIFMPAITDFKKVKTQKLNLDKNKTNFLFVGRLEKVKGIDILIDAVNELETKSNNFLLNILGGGNLKIEMETKVKNYKLKNRVNFLGFVGKETVASYMKQSDCLIVPSRSESMPLVIIEAARVNLPVIASNVGDCKRVIEKYKIGCWVKSQDKDELASAMLKFITAFKKTPDFQSGDELIHSTSSGSILSEAEVLNAVATSSFRGNPALQSGEDVIDIKKTGHQNRFAPGLLALSKDFTQEKAVEILLRNI